MRRAPDSDTFPGMTSYETLTETEWAEVDRIEDLLEEGELDEARAALDDLMRRRPGHPDLRVEFSGPLRRASQVARTVMPAGKPK